MRPERRAAFIFAISAAALAMIVASGLFSCGGRAKSPSPPGSAVAAESLALSVRLNAGSYAIGEKVMVRLVVSNTTARPLSLVFPTAQTADFVVRKGRDIIWRWSDEMMFAQVLSGAAIAPHDSVIYGAQWNQKLADGTNAALGAYTIQGILVTRPEKVTEEKRFGIAD
ncbi:MAG: BsuPI-related putative proteinase inhibitor [Candidatus Eisenbacteria bacterium]